MGKATSGVQTTIWILTDPDQPELTIWGISGAERLRRVLVAADTPADRIGVGPLAALQAQRGDMLIVRADYVFDERLIRALLDLPAAHNSVLFAPGSPQRAVAARVEARHREAALALLSGAETLQSTGSQAGLRSLAPSDLVPAYNPALRKAAVPYVLPIQAQRLSEIEACLFRASYKGITDVVTKWVWPRPAQAVVRILARAGVRPNTVTVLSWLLVIGATWLFSVGSFGLGLLAAWLMTFLDTVDGKLARLSLTTSKLGHVLDHGLDLIHPPFWYLAWAVGLPGGAVWLGPALVITLLGYVLGGVCLRAFFCCCSRWKYTAGGRLTPGSGRSRLAAIRISSCCPWPVWAADRTGAWWRWRCGRCVHSPFMVCVCCKRVANAGVASPSGPGRNRSPWAEVWSSPGLVRVSCASVF